MIDYKTLTNNIEEALIKDYLENAFDLVIKNLRKESPRYDSFIALAGRNNGNTSDKFSGTLNRDEFIRERNAIRESFLHSFKQLTEEDFLENLSPGERSETAIAEPILVISPDEEAKNFMEKYFTALNFSKVDVQVTNTFISAENYDLIVFDNQDLPYPKDRTDKLTETQKAFVKARTDLMEEFLKNTNKFAVHFGGYLNWIENEERRKRVAAANFPFTLFTAIQGMLDFIKRYDTKIRADHK